MHIYHDFQNRLSLVKCWESWSPEPGMILSQSILGWWGLRRHPDTKRDTQALSESKKVRCGPKLERPELIPGVAGHGNVQILDSSQTWSLQTLNCIRFWLKTCTSCHEPCSKPKEPSRLPLRLIDVNAAGTIQIQSTDKIGQEYFDQLRLKNSHSVRIVSTKSLSPTTEYLTLSHRWGSPPSILLSRETSFLLTEDISPYLLDCQQAIVFEHAIHVTRGLGFRYIWIDALCIMQDDGPEKMVEVMQMGDIYFNAKLNISAAEADIFRGLVFERKSFLTNPCMTAAKVPGIQEDMSLYVFCEKWSLRQGEKPLHKRGWLFQERELSPRIVHFSEDQVFWECWSLKATEVLPLGVPDRRPGDIIKSIGIDAKTSDAQQIKSRWYELVEAYSRASLTFANDHLLAISGVAKRFCSAMCVDPSEYLAGMWKNDLPLSMLWFQDSIPGRSGPAEIGPDLEMKYAPSWSWASIMTSIATVDLSSLVATTSVIDFEIRRISQNFLDGTEFCRLRLRGPLCKFRRHLQDGTPCVQIAEDIAFQEFETFDFQKGKFIVILWDTARRFSTKEYFFLHVATEISEDGPLERGVILMRTAERGTYKRVGGFFVPFTSEYSGSKLEDALRGGFDTLSTDDYLELDSDGKYVINVI